MSAPRLVERLQAALAPLRFAARQDFAQLARVRDLEPTLARALRALQVGTGATAPAEEASALLALLPPPGAPLQARVAGLSQVHRRLEAWLRRAQEGGSEPAAPVAPPAARPVGPVRPVGTAAVSPFAAASKASGPLQGTLAERSGLAAAFGWTKAAEGAADGAPRAKAGALAEPAAAPGGAASPTPAPSQCPAAGGEKAARAKGVARQNAAVRRRLAGRRGGLGARPAAAVHPRRRATHGRGAGGPAA